MFLLIKCEITALYMCLIQLDEVLCTKYAKLTKISPMQHPLRILLKLELEVTAA